MANPYTVNIAQTDTPSSQRLMQGLGSIIKQNREQKKKEKQQSDFRAAWETQDPETLSNYMIDNPESAGLMNQLTQNKDARTSKNQTDTLRNVLSDPDNSVQHMQDRVDFLKKSGANSDTAEKRLILAKDKPDEFQRAAEMAFAGKAPKEYKAFKGAQANMTEYQRQTLDLKREANDIRKLEKEARTEDNQLKRDELEFRLNERKQKSREKQTKKKFDASAKVRQQTALSDSIDTFMNNDDYMDSMTGYRGRLPAVTTTGIEAEAYFDNIKNNLTLENLDKMTGVLSETDIKILSTAATALQAGMSKTKMKAELNKIKKVLSTKSADVQAQLMGGEPGQGRAQPTQEQQLPPQNQQSIDDLLKKYGN